MLVFDALAEILQTMHLQSAVFCRSEFRSPWGVQIGKEYGYKTKFHIVVSGQCWLQVQGLDAPVCLSDGDFVFLPPGTTHSLSDTLTSPVVSLEKILQPIPSNGFRTFHYGGAETQTPTIIVSGGMTFRESATNPLLAALPLLIHIKGEEGRLMPWLTTTLQSLECETASDLPGRQTVLTRLADILFVQAVRSYLAQLPQQGGWLRALCEPGIGLALGLLHRYPEQNWTVATLAQRVSMSRSGFAARFTRLVGTPPLKYLTHWRMSKAAELLQSDRWSIKEVAVQVGYDSDVAFTQAFKRWSGLPPGAYRRSR